MQPLKNELPRIDVLFVFYGFENTQDTKISENAIEHIPKLICVQQFCSLCEMQDDILTVKVVVKAGIHSSMTL
jgi:hypothetical protein